jgi:hypothetical protein
MLITRLNSTRTFPDIRLTGGRPFCNNAPAGCRVKKIETHAQCQLAMQNYVTGNSIVHILHTMIRSPVLSFSKAFQVFDI